MSKYNNIDTNIFKPQLNKCNKCGLDFMCLVEYIKICPSCKYKKGGGR